MDFFISGLEFFSILFLILFSIVFYGISSMLCCLILSKINKEAMDKKCISNMENLIFTISILPFFNTLYCIYRFKMVCSLIKL